MQTSCYGWKACARLAAARAQPQPQPQPELQSQSQSQLLRRAVRQSDGRADRQTNEGEGGREVETDKQRPQACTIRRSQARQAVSRRRGNRLRNSFPRYNNHNSHKHARAHTTTHTHKHTQSHSNIEAQPQLKSFYCPQHKRAQRASVSESGRANTHTHHRAYVNRSQQRNNNSCSRRKREGRIQFSSRTRQNARLTRTLSGSAARAEPIKSTTRTAS